jgi:hypothetical protein
MSVSKLLLFSGTYRWVGQLEGWYSPLFIEHPLEVTYEKLVVSVNIGPVRKCIQEICKQNFTFAQFDRSSIGPMTFHVAIVAIVLGKLAAKKILDQCSSFFAPFISEYIHMAFEKHDLWAAFIIVNGL